MKTFFWGMGMAVMAVSDVQALSLGGFGNFNSLMNRIERVGNAVGNKLNQQTQKAIDKVNTGIQKAGNEIHQGMNKVGNAVNKGTQTVIGGVHQGIGQIGKGLNRVGLSPVGNLVNKVNNTTTQALLKTNALAGTAYQALNNTTYRGLSTVNQGLYKGAQATANGLHDATQAAGHGLIKATVATVNFIPQAANKVKNISEDAIQEAKGVIHKVGNFTQDATHKVGDFTQDTAHKVGYGIRDQAVNIYQGSRVMRNLVDDVKTMVDRSRGTIESWQRGDFVGGIKESAQVLDAFSDVATMGVRKVAQDFGTHLVTSIKAAKEGNWNKALLNGEAVTLDGATIGVTMVGGPLAGMVMGPKDVTDINNAAVGLGMSGRDLGVAIGHQANNLFGQGKFDSADFKAVVDAGGNFQNQVTNVVATGFTNLDLGREALKEGVGEFNQGTQSLGNAAVETTQSIQQFARGDYLGALKTGSDVALDATQGVGKMGGSAITVAQTAAGASGVGLPAEVALAVAGAAFNTAGNIKNITSGYKNALENYVSGSKQVLEGDVGTGFQHIGVSVGQGALATTLAGTSALSGGMGKLLGRGAGNLVGKLGGRGISALNNLASRAVDKGSNLTAKVASGGSTVLEKVTNVGQKIAPKIITIGNSVTKFGSGQAVKYEEGKSLLQKGVSVVQGATPYIQGGAVLVQEGSSFQGGSPFLQGAASLVGRGASWTQRGASLAQRGAAVIQKGERAVDTFIKPVPLTSAQLYASQN